MRKSFIIGLTFALVSCGSSSLRAEAPETRQGLAPVALPGGIGVNIHFTDPRPGEMEMLAGGGFTWVRMDLNWAGTERKAGEYDFSAFDRLMSALEKHHIRPIFILDYSNRLYDDGLSPHTDAGRAAFAAWSVAAVHHFRGRSVLWEMYNEPNGSFWKPKANVEEYAKLALVVGKALREAEPGEPYIGPATSGFGLEFMETCFKAGLLEYWSAVSCHPYRQGEPETAADEYRKLRMLIARYAPPGKRIPIISGEWGYSTAWHGIDEERQGQYAARELLTNLWQEVPLSIWYDWHEDGTDPKEPEHHFGVVHHAYHKDATPVYEPKPGYLAVRALTTQLAGFSFNKRLAMESPTDFVLLFDRGTRHEEQRLVVWTTAADPHAVTIPTSPGAFSVQSHIGQSLPELMADQKGLTVVLSGSPLYLAPRKSDGRLRAAAEWERLPLEIIRNGPAEVRLGMGTPPVQLDRSTLPHEVRVNCAGPGLSGFVQETEVAVVNPLSLTILPRSSASLPVRLQDPSAAGFKGTIVVSDINGLELTATREPVEIAAGQTEAVVRFPIREGNAARSFAVQVSVVDASGRALLTEPSMNVGNGADFAAGPWTLSPDGSGKVHSEQSLAVQSPLAGPPEPGMGVLKITYKTESGWKFWMVHPTTPGQRSIEGEPKSCGLWIFGNDGRELPRMRFSDSSGQTFQTGSEMVTWKGWRFVSFPMQGPIVAHSHWGGKNDGIIHYPIHWDSVFLLDREADRSVEGTLYIAGPMLVR